MKRRDFLAVASGAAAGALLGCRGGDSGAAEIPGGIAGPSVDVGHLLRGGADSLPRPHREEKIPLVIVGGGVSGLSAAWKLSRSGFHEYLLLELEPEIGGNSRSGGNRVSAYPWGAHYVPLPGPEAAAMRELFADLGVIERYENGQPVYNEYFLCAAPQERLLVHGTWQEGLIPQLGTSAAERAELRDFFSLMDRFRAARGGDGRKAFAIPVADSSGDPAYAQFDGMTMSQFMAQRGFTAPSLRWYVDYCCRDDYGAGMDLVSAWAGIHYFAARPGDAGLVTWPAGNGWLVGRLRGKITGTVRGGALVTSVAPAAGGQSVDYYDVAGKNSVRVLAERVIYAGPRFTALHAVAPLRERRPAWADAFTYSPWMVANLTLDALPAGRGAALAWDNVSYDSRSLGYVVATHQALDSRPRETVVTYYQPLDHLEPKLARAEALARPYAAWQAQTLADLERFHPGFRSSVRRLDVWLWGHGMIRPVPGFIRGGARQAAQQALGSVHFAHSDLSGISIFEEAHYWGVKAAQEAMAALRVPFAESL